MANTGDNYGAVLEALNDKMDRDVENRSTGVETVVERWHDENGNFYRLWSDGWLEQGGYKNSGSSNAVVTFFKEFKDTNYLTLMANTNSSLATAATAVTTNPSSKTTTKCTYAVASYSYGFCWYACGYAATNS